MSDFYKKFLVEEPRRFSANGRYVALAAFGKHPGWDDHVEDLGLETESLNLAKTLLYVNGIGGQIDSGAWEKLDATQQLANFKHVFVWQRSGQILMGRMWSSSDGKGRKRYPMVVCAHLMGVTLGWAIKQVLPSLAELERECVNTSSAEDVRTALSRKRAALREAVLATDGRGEYAPVTPDSLHRILQSDAPDKREGFLRVLYQMQGQLGGFVDGKFNPKVNPAALRAQQIRVPAVDGDSERSLLFWSRFFLAYLDAAVPLLLAMPLEENWIDITAGEPESHEFFCLRASPKAVPLVSEVPYKLDESFCKKAVSFLDHFQRGESVPKDLQPATTLGALEPAAPRSGWRKWLGFSLLLVLAAAALVFFFPKREDAKKAGPTAKVNSLETNAQRTGVGPVSQSSDEAKKPEVRKTAQSQLDEAAEATRLLQEKKQSEAMAAAAKLNADVEAAAKEKERQIAEAALKEKQRIAAEAAAKLKEKQMAEAASQAKAQELARQNEAKLAEQKLAQQIQEKNPKPVVELAGLVTSASNVVARTSAGPAVLPASGQMTNSIGMVFVSLRSNLWVGKYEVTQAEYQKVMGKNPSKWVNELEPVEQVSWNEATEFVRKLTDLERDRLPAGRIYNLPTDKQWKEYLGGQRFWDLPRQGKTGKSEPSPVGQSSSPNKYGLFDVLGNVWEWCLDGADGGKKLLKGGAFDDANFEQTMAPEQQGSNCGFRCVLTGM